MKRTDVLQKIFKFKDCRDLYFCVDCECDYNTNVQSISYVKLTADGKLPSDWRRRCGKTIDLESVDFSLGGLNGPYETVSDFDTLDTIVPDNMDEPTRSALKNLKKALGGDVSGFVAERLQMSRKQLRKSLKAEQVDAVALAIYNIEARKQGIIIGDQTGIGKGRQAAAIIRYAHTQGCFPIFLTAAPNLFSDLYRDCKALGIGDLHPFIFNNAKIYDTETVDTTKTKAEIEKELKEGEDEEEEFKCPANIEVDSPEYAKLLEEFKAKQEARRETAKFKVVYPLRGEGKERAQAFKEGAINYSKYDYAISTYSQFNKIKDISNLHDLSTSGLPTNRKGRVLANALLHKKVIFILDEAHNAAGDSNTGAFFQLALQEAEGAVYLSATYAKRPDNMGLFAMKTAIGASGLSADTLQDAIANGGVPLQEVLSSHLVQEGQMLRRERSLENIQVDYITLNKECAAYYEGIEDTEEQDIIRCNKVTSILREIVEFQRDWIDTIEQVGAPKGGILKHDKDVGGTKKSPIFSQLFHVVEAILLSVKAESIAKRVAYHVHNGRKVVIAISRTNETAIKNTLNSDGYPCTIGDIINGDIGNTIKGFLRQAVRSHTKDAGGKSTGAIYLFDENDKPNYAEIPFEMEVAYKRLSNKIKSEIFNLPLSPIDAIVKKINSMGIIVGECTGRGTRLEYLDDKYKEARVVGREKADRALLFNDFQNNVIDVLLINTTGATGASAHAIPTKMVKEKDVKQRVMIIAQPELDINTEIQKRGRINRTGQLKNLPPIYEYMSSAIPAEQRQLMILKRKLKSLDANTSSNQKQNDKQLDIPDFQNKYGDQVVADWLVANKEINNKLGDPLKIEETKEGDSINIYGAAQKVSGRVAILSCEEQKQFYDEVLESYNSFVQDKIAKGTYDLESEVCDFEARLMQKNILCAGNSNSANSSFFSGNTYINSFYCKCNKRILTVDELVDKINQIEDKNDEIEELCVQSYNSQIEKVRENLKNTIDKINEKYDTSLKYFVPLPQNDADLDKMRRKLAAKLHPDKHPEDPDKYTSEMQRMNAEYDRIKDGTAFETNPKLEREIEDAKAKANTLILNLQNMIKRVQGVASKFRKGTIWRDCNVVNEGENYASIAVCLGVKLKTKDTSHITPQNIVVDFVLANKTQTNTSYNLVFSAARDCGMKSLQNIYDEYRDSEGYNRTFGGNISEAKWYQYFVTNWQKEYDKNKNGVMIRKIVTGNLISAWNNRSIYECSPRPKTIFFTCKHADGSMTTETGLLMPLQSAEKQKNANADTITLPIKAGFKIAASLDASFPMKGSYCDIKLVSMPYHNNKIRFCFEKGEKETQFVRMAAKQNFIFSDSEVKRGNKKLWSLTFVNDNDYYDSKSELDRFIDFLDERQYKIDIERKYINESIFEEEVEHDASWSPLKWNANNIPLDEDEEDVPDGAEEAVEEERKKAQRAEKKERKTKTSEKQSAGTDDKAQNLNMRIRIANANAHALLLSSLSFDNSTKTKDGSLGSVGSRCVSMRSERIKQLSSYIREAQREGAKYLNVIKDYSSGYKFLYSDRIFRNAMKVFEIKRINAEQIINELY